MPASFSLMREPTEIDLGHLLADELGDIGFFADAFAFLAEFEVAPDEGELPTTGESGR